MAASSAPVRVVQNAYVVPDLEAACHRLHGLFRIGPFFRLPPREIRDVVYRGRLLDAPLVIEVALAMAGDVQVELIRQTSPGPSAFRDMYGEHDTGLHHVAYFASDFATERRAFVDAGYEVAMEMPGRGDYRICYIDARAAVGHMIEIYPDHPMLRGLYAYVEEHTSAWDGSDLIQPIALAPAS